LGDASDCINLAIVLSSFSVIYLYRNSICFARTIYWTYYFLSALSSHRCTHLKSF